MAWSGDCSEYEEGDNGDESSSDLEELPDDELIIVLRDEQDSINEAQRLIHKEIRSIRRELKKILRNYDASQLVQQPLHDDHQADMSDSGVRTPSYVTTEYNTASEVTSSHGDSESGFQATIECDSNGATGQAFDERFRRQSTGMHEPRLRSSSVNLPVSSGRSTPNASRTLYEITPHQLVNSETHHDMTDHTSGLNSTYEDAYIMMRRRHRQGDSSPKKNGTSRETGNRWRSTPTKHGERIYSIPESDQTRPLLREHPENGQTTVQSSEDELGEYPASQINTKHCPHIRNRSQSVGQIQLNSDIPSPVTFDENYLWPDRPHSTTTQSTKSRKRTEMRTGSQYERPTSAASSDSDHHIQPDQHLQPHLLDSSRRLSVLSSEEEPRASPRFSDSSYDSHVGMDSHGFTPQGHPSPRLVRRRDYPHKDRNSYPSIDAHQQSRDSVEGYWGDGASQAPSSHVVYQGYDVGLGAHTDRSSDHKNHNLRLKYDRTNRTEFIRGISKTSAQPVMKVRHQDIEIAM